MINSFDDREKGFEAKFKLDQETEFAITARRNKLLGLWLGEKLGLNDSEISEFAASVVASDLEEPGDEEHEFRSVFIEHGLGFALVILWHCIDTLCTRGTLTKEVRSGRDHMEKIL